MWGHAVAPSTPPPDFKLHLRAWQQNFAAIYGWEALGRVRGFSPPEMHLPNHPDAAFTFVKALKECGYKWLLLQEHTVETTEGHGLRVGVQLRRRRVDDHHVEVGLQLLEQYAERVSREQLLPA